MGRNEPAPRVIPKRVKVTMCPNLSEEKYYRPSSVFRDKFNTLLNRDGMLVKV